MPAEYAAQAVEQEGVACAQSQAPGSREFARSLRIVEQPAKLACRKIWIERQSGPFERERLEARALQSLELIARSFILPYDGVVEGTLRQSVPCDNGLALIGEADRP